MDSDSLEIVEEEQLIDKLPLDAYALQNIFNDRDESVSSAVLTAEDLLKELLEKIVEDDKAEESVHSVLVTVENLIENAFSNYLSRNVTVHFKTLQTVLLVIANQLQVLKRQIKLDLGNITSEELMNIKATVSITQLNVHTQQVPKKKMRKAVPQKKCKVCNQKRTCLSCLGDVKEKGRYDKKKKEKVLVGKCSDYIYNAIDRNIRNSFYSPTLVFFSRSWFSSQDLYGNSMVTVAELADLEEYVQLLEDTALDAESKQISELAIKLQAAEAELQRMNDKATTLCEMQRLRREIVTTQLYKIYLSKKLAETPDPNESMIAEIEAVVAAYVSKINSFDSIVSLKMSEFQEELHEMQHALETNLELIAEAMSNPSGHEQAYSELYGRCRKVQLEVQALDLAQQELEEFQRSLVVDLEKSICAWKISLRNELIEIYRILLGKNTVEQDAPSYFAVARWYTLNVEEYPPKTIFAPVAQQRELDDKMEKSQVDAVREDIIQLMLNLQNRAEQLQGIVGDLRLPVGKSRLARDDDCFSCSAPPFLSN
ncbi:hypothetical protein EVAR_6478_1 [Eumeta japonica]|uniref:Uncharacterized protein n=1 Tax=Eumeta variegata TaxID=151549 RepID=A0A4C1SSL7_EUMVA|nr:hypothetical protein EVAR_6478_1 [Eumeta japonica]